MPGFQYERYTEAALGVGVRVLSHIQHGHALSESQYYLIRSTHYSMIQPLPATPFPNPGPVVLTERRSPPYMVRGSGAAYC
jgi:hypothetical protein